MSISILSENNVATIEGVLRKLGKAKAVKSSPKLLHMANYAGDVYVPPTYDFWSGRTDFPIQDWGNNKYGDCTIASQGEGAQRMERLEQRKTITIPAQSIIDVYFNLTTRLYGGGDMGAYELDALNNWRREDLTFRDTYGHPYTIQAFTAINHRSIDEVKKALYLSGSKGIKVCFALPLAWASRTDYVWDIPEGQQPIGEWLPYSWGGHSTWSISKYDKDWVWILSTWQTPPFKMSWRAFSIYADEAYMVIDNVNSWKKRLAKKEIDFKALVADVNMVSDVKI